MSLYNLYLPRSIMHYFNRLIKYSKYILKNVDFFVGSLWIE